jgi:hypothetical protein
MCALVCKMCATCSGSVLVTTWKIENEIDQKTIVTPTVITAINAVSALAESP